MADFDLMLRNVRVFADSDGVGVLPDADAVAVRGGRIAAVGRYGELAGGVGSGTAVVDCGGRLVVAGLVDAHLHLFAAAARAGQVDCRPGAALDVAAVIAALRAAASSAGAGWVRGYGYDDAPAGLGRHLDRRDLDLVSLVRPVRVDHRSGHAVVLNTAGLFAMGIASGVPDPPGGVVVRDAAGHPTGLLLEPAAWDWPAAPALTGVASDYPAGLGELGQRLVGYGITAVTDAGAGNGIAKWYGLASAVAAGVLPLRVTMMAGWGQLAELRRAGLRYGDTTAGGILTLGHAKIMLTASGGALHPDPEGLTAMVRQAQQAGYPAAIHAVERDAVVGAAMSLSDVPPPAGSRHRIARRHRIEHCAECPPDVADLVRRSGARAVVNPAWLHYDGGRYAATVAAELRPHLHPAGALYAAGVPLGLGSDAPVVEANPWAGLAAAVSRRSAGGIELGGMALPSVSSALGIQAGGRRIAVGRAADLAVIAPNPLALALGDLPAVRAALTIVDGRVVWRDGV